MLHAILSFLKAKKGYAIGIGVVLIFIILRIILLQKPSTDILYTVKSENLVDTVQVSGTYTTAALTSVTSPATGVISKLYVSNGDLVTKGKPLFYVESTATVDQKNAAYADYQNALSTLQTSQNNVQSLDATMWTQQQSYISAQNSQNYMINNTVNPATKQNYTDLEKFAINNAVVQTKKAFDAAEQAYKTANVSVGAAQAKVTQTKRAYDETQSVLVTSPATGKVVNLEDKIGDSVSAPTTTSPTSPAVLVVADLSHPYISVDIGEDYATRVSSGQTVTVVFDALKNQTFTGRLSDIATVGTTTEGVVTYPARVEIATLPEIIKPNMTALVTIETLRKNNVLDVPNSAIVEKNGQIYVIEATKHKQLPVTIGVKGLAKTEITSGLATGAVIVANPGE